jgi:bile acid:Na+ symporter, BASS family
LPWGVPQVAGFYATAAAVFYIPLVLELLNQILTKPIHMQDRPIAEMILKTTLAPLLAGMFVRRLIPRIASRIVKPVAFCAAAALIVSFLPVLYAASPAIFALLGNRTILAIAAFVVVDSLSGLCSAAQILIIELCWPSRPPHGTPA